MNFFWTAIRKKIFDYYFEIFWVARFFYFNNYYIQKCPYKVGTTWPWRFPLGCKSGYFLDWWTWLNINLSVLENLSWMKNISYSMYYFQTLKQQHKPVRLQERYIPEVPSLRCCKCQPTVVQAWSTVLKMPASIIYCRIILKVWPAMFCTTEPGILSQIATIVFTRNSMSTFSRDGSKSLFLH